MSVDVSRYNLSPSTDGFNDHLRSIMQGDREKQQLEKQAAQKTALEKIQVQLQDNANQALLIRDLPDDYSKRAAIIKMGQQAIDNGGDPAMWMGMLDSETPDELNRKIMGLALKGTDGSKFIADKLKPKEYSQGSGVMAGFAFDKTDGSFKIAPEVQQRIMTDASEQAKQDGMLGPKKIADINDKISGLTKDVNGITKAAKSLASLKDRGTPAAQVAAVFQFMKSLDPTSTVRESELGMVYSAEGAAQGIANKLNQILGEGALSGTGFADIVSTANALANSAVDSSNDMVDKYLDVLSDKMTERDFEKLKSRVPDRIEITEDAKALDWARANKNDPRSKEIIRLQGIK